MEKIIKAKFSNGVIKPLEKAELKEAPEGLTLSIISLAEVYGGVFHSRNPKKSEKALEEFLIGISILGIDEKICKTFGKERGRLRKEGKMIGDPFRPW